MRPRAAAAPAPGATDAEARWVEARRASGGDADARWPFCALHLPTAREGESTADEMRRAVAPLVESEMIRNAAPAAAARAPPGSCAPFDWVLEHLDASSAPDGLGIHPQWCELNLRIAARHAGLLPGGRGDETPPSPPPLSAPALVAMMRAGLRAMPPAQRASCLLAALQKQMHLMTLNGFVKEALERRHGEDASTAGGIPARANRRAPIFRGFAEDFELGRGRPRGLRDGRRARDVCARRPYPRRPTSRYRAAAPADRERARAPRLDGDDDDDDDARILVDPQYGVAAAAWLGELGARRDELPRFGAHAGRRLMAWAVALRAALKLAYGVLWAEEKWRLVKGLGIAAVNVLERMPDGATCSWDAALAAATFDVAGKGFFFVSCAVEERGAPTVVMRYRCVAHGERAPFVVDLECPVCHEEDTEPIARVCSFAPCGHEACAACARQLARCPMSRADPRVRRHVRARGHAHREWRRPWKRRLRHTALPRR